MVVLLFLFATSLFAAPPMVPVVSVQVYGDQAEIQTFVQHVKDRVQSDPAVKVIEGGTSRTEELPGIWLVNVQLSFKNKATARNFLQFMKDKVVAQLHGEVTAHMCPRSRAKEIINETWKGCKNDPRAEFVAHQF